MNSCFLSVALLYKHPAKSFSVEENSRLSMMLNDGSGLADEWKCLLYNLRQYKQL